MKMKSVKRIQSLPSIYIAHKMLQVNIHTAKPLFSQPRPPDKANKPEWKNHVSFYAHVIDDFRVAAEQLICTVIVPMCRTHASQEVCRDLPGIKSQHGLPANEDAERE